MNLETYTDKRTNLIFHNQITYGNTILTEKPSN
jgi:hypothetical protein